MDNTLLIPIKIRKILSESKELLELISIDNIFPLIAMENTKNPYIVYQRELQPVYNKDLITGNTILFTFIVVSDDYDLGVYIANALRHSLENYRYKDDDIIIDPIKLANVTESTDLLDEYNLTLTFSITAR